MVCRLLPLERRYYWWLLFAPSDSRKWQAFIRRLIEEGELEILAVATKLKPGEVTEMVMEIKDQIENSRERDELAPYLEAFHRVQLYLLNEAKDDPEEQIRIIQASLEVLRPEQRLLGLKPEERLVGLKPEERRRLLELLTQDVADEE